MASPPGRERHPIFARFYGRVSPGMDAAGVGEIRQRLLAGLSGRVLEIGAGNGLNFRYYPESVSEVIAIEPEPHLRKLALRAAASAPVPVDVRAGVAETVPLPDSSVDAAVASVVLCSVDDQMVVLRELRRVLRPRGVLRYYE